MSASSSPTQPQTQSNYQRAILEKIEDPVSCELMTRAVTIIPCGHTLNEGTVTQCLAHNELCPIDRQPIERYIPNYTVRHLAETVDSLIQEKESYSLESETHFLKGKKALEDGNIEGAIEAFLEALRLSPYYEQAQDCLELCLKTAQPSSKMSAHLENIRKKQEERKAKTHSDKEAYIDYLLHLLEKPVIISNPSLSQLLKKEVEQLMNQESAELNETSIEKYNWTKKLLIDQKVSSFVIEKLQQLSLFPCTFSGPNPSASHSSPAPSPYSSVLNPTPVYSSPIYKPVKSSVPEMAFGKAKWNKYFGDIGTEPPLPSDIEQILNSECIFWPGKKVRETHLLVLIPNTVNGKAFHLNSLAELIKRPKTGHKTQYRHYSKYVKQTLGTESVRSHWVLMTKDVIPDSRRKTYSDQEALVASHEKKSQVPYSFPKALDATTAILMEHVQTGTRLYSDSPLTYTRCQRHTWAVSIGGFSSEGLDVHRVSHWSGSDLYVASSLGFGCKRQARTI